MEKILFISTLSIIVILICSCYHQADYNKPLSSTAFNLTATSSSIPADSFSTVTITVKIPEESDDSLSMVTFKTTAGTFVDNGLNSITVKAKKYVDSTNKIASVALKSSLTVQTAVVSVDLFDNKQNLNIDFTRSYPDDLHISSSTLSVKPSNDATGEVSLTAQITKAHGYPSIGDTIDLKGYDLQFSKQLGSFRIYNNQSNSVGNANYVFVLGDSIANNLPKPYTGPFYIIGQTFDGTRNKHIYDTIKIISSQ